MRPKPITFTKIYPARIRRTRAVSNRLGYRHPSWIATTNLHFQQFLGQTVAFHLWTCLGSPYEFWLDFTLTVFRFAFFSKLVSCCTLKMCQFDFVFFFTSFCSLLVHLPHSCRRAFFISSCNLQFLLHSVAYELYLPREYKLIFVLHSAFALTPRRSPSQFCANPILIPLILV